MNSKFTQEDLVSANLEALEHFRSLSLTALDALESLSALTLNVARENWVCAATHTKALLESKSPQEAASVAMQATQPTAERILAYTRQIYEISHGAAQEIGKTVQSKIEKHQRVAQDAAEKFAKSSPYASDESLAALRHADLVASQAFENITNAIENAKAFAGVNFEPAAAKSKKTKRTGSPKKR